MTNPSNGKPLNLRLENYVSGAAYLVRVSYRKGGRRVAILDKARHLRPVARLMRRAGRSECEIAAALRLPRHVLARILAGWAVLPNKLD